MADSLVPWLVPGRDQRWERLATALDVLIAEAERWEARAGELYDQLRQEQEAHLMLAGEMQEQRDTTGEYEDMAYGAAAMSEAAEVEIETLREELRDAREQIDELLAERAATFTDSLGGDHDV